MGRCPRRRRSGCRRRPGRKSPRRRTPGTPGSRRTRPAGRSCSSPCRTARPRWRPGPRGRSPAAPGARGPLDHDLDRVAAAPGGVGGRRPAVSADPDVRPVGDVAAVDHHGAAGVPDLDHRPGVAAGDDVAAGHGAAAGVRPRGAAVAGVRADHDAVVVGAGPGPPGQSEQAAGRRGRQALEDGAAGGPRGERPRQVVERCPSMPGTPWLLALPSIRPCRRCSRRRRGTC